MATAPSKIPSEQQKIAALEQQVESLKQQLDWFQRQLFGRKSEKRRPEDLPEQPLLNGFDVEAGADTPVEREHIAYTRNKHRADDCVSDSGLRFNASVPVKTIELTAPELSGPHADEYEIISEKVSYRLAQAKTSYQVLKYVRPVVKHRASGALSSPPAAPALWPGSIADVSVVAGLLVEKFVYHMPLYRQHQRMGRDGVVVSRESLTNWSRNAIGLLEPIYQAQLQHILLSKTLSIDETPVKAGRGKPGKMKLGWYWPIYGEADEVAFTFSPSRGHQHLVDILAGFSGTLLTDGYGAYTRFISRCEDIEHAQCWAHSRREFLKAQKAEPDAVAQALDFIGALYKVETDIREHAELDTLAHRQRYSQAIVDGFFAWCEVQVQRMDLVPSAPLSKAFKYVRKREPNLRLFLADAALAIDTNHLERTLRVIPMGKKAWLFAWTEVGARHVGIVQSLLSTCRLHGVDPYTYLVDVLQRVGQHPADQVEQLTPRLWQRNFGDNPLRSDLESAASL